MDRNFSERRNRLGLRLGLGGAFIPLFCYHICMKKSKATPFASNKTLFKGLVKTLKRESAKDLWYRTIDWTRYLDPAIAAHIQSVRYRNKILYLETQSSTFAHRFHYLRDDVKTKLAKDYSQEISDIRCTLSRV